MTSTQIEWAHYPNNAPCPWQLTQIIDCFKIAERSISSKSHQLKSNEVLEELAPSLEGLGFKVERSKQAKDKIHVPVLFGRNGQATKTFEADAYHADEGIVLEVEAGRGYANNQFLKDLFQASVMQGVEYAAIAVRLKYRDSPDFERVVNFMDTLYASDRLRLPLTGLLIVGY